jgi:tryptophanyl-tRNA synthetase
MSLQNPLVKMSKSDKNPLATINLLDSKDAIFEKIKKAVTDSGEEIVKRADKPAISNLLNIYSSIAKLSIEDLESRYRGKGYEVFKNDLAEVLIQFLLPLQKRYFEIRENTGFLNRVLDEGRDFAIEKSSVTIRKVNSAVGLGR